MITIESSADARIVRDEMVGHIDGLVGSADDDLYQRLVALRSEIILDINRRIAILPNIEEFTPAKTIPALVLAHNLLGDGSRDSEIINRNSIQNPVFVTGGRVVEVLK